MYSGCIFISVSMYVYSYQSTDGISGQAAVDASQCRGMAENYYWVNSEIPSKAVVTQHWRYTRSWWRSVIGDTLGSIDGVNLEMHSEMVIDRVCWCFQRLKWRIFEDRLGGCEWVWWGDTHYEIMIELVWRCTWRLFSCELGDILGGCKSACLEICSWRRWLRKLGSCYSARVEIHMVLRQKELGRKVTLIKVWWGVCRNLGK